MRKMDMTTRQFMPCLKVPAIECFERSGRAAVSILSGLRADR